MFGEGNDDYIVPGVSKCDRSDDNGAMLVMVDEGNVDNDQGCISCGILVSGIRARGVSSEHMENMEMFSCSPT